MSDTDSQAVQGPPKTLMELHQAQRGWSPKGARLFAGFNVLLYSLVLLALTLAVRGEFSWGVLIINSVNLIMPTITLVRALRDKKYPLREALKRGYSNPDYPPEEAAFVHKMFGLYMCTLATFLAGFMLVVFGGISYFSSERTRDDAITAFYFISGGFTVIPMGFVAVRRVYRRLDAKWGSYVALRDGSSEKQSA